MLAFLSCIRLLFCSHEHSDKKLWVCCASLTKPWHVIYSRWRNQSAFGMADTGCFWSKHPLKVDNKRVVFEAETSGGSKAGGLPTLLFPSPPPFHSPYILSLPVGGKVRSSEGEVPRLPPLQIPPWIKPQETWFSTNRVQWTLFCSSHKFSTGKVTEPARRLVQSEWS